jgi:hypothetical protein
MPVMTVARLGVARLGAFRLNAFVQPQHPTIKGTAWVKVLINGIDRTEMVRVAGMSITDELNHAPNTATFRMSSATVLTADPVGTMSGASAPGTGLTVGGEYRWKVTFVTAAGESLPGFASNPHTIPTPVAPSTPPPLAANLTNAHNFGSGTGPTSGGTYAYKATWWHNGTLLESEAGPATAGFVSDGTSGAADYDTAAGTGMPAWANRLRIYRTAAGGSTYVLFPWAGGPFAAFAAGAGTLVDSATDAELTDIEPPTAGGDMAQVTVSAIPVSPDPGVTARKIYRTEANGSTYKFVATIANNTATTYLDATPDGSLGATAPVVSTAAVPITPLVGHEVKIYLGDTDVAHQLFGGHILSREQGFEGKPAAPNIYWDVTCTDYTWLLNRRTVIKKYSSQSATAIILDLIATYTSGITTAHVSPGLATIDEITFTNEDLPDALTRITERIGGYWYLDYGKDLHVFLTEPDTAHAVVDGSVFTSDVSQDADLSQVATRVVVRGGGSNTAADIAVGQTTIPVEDGSWYTSGVVESGPQRISYTGVAGVTETGSAIGAIAAPPATFTVQAILSSMGSMDPNATYGYALTWVTAAGESTPGTTVFGNSGPNQWVDLLTLPTTTDPAVTAKKVYRTEGGGAVLKFLVSLSPTSTTHVDSAADGTLGAVPPTVNTAGPSGLAFAAGSTSLPVEDTAAFPASGWAMAPGDQLFSYTGRTTTSGTGSLTGIPVSGVGSLTAAVRSGTLKVVPHLTGVTGVLYAINKGEPVNIVVTVNDTAAQAVMAAAVGGDGIHEMFLSDGRWSITEATARATAELSQRKDPLATTHVVSRDQTIQSGRTISFSLTNPAITGTAKIQRVTISEIGIFGPTGTTLPKRTVECSSRMYSFEDLLRVIKGRAA